MIAIAMVDEFGALQAKFSNSMILIPQPFY